MNNVHKSFILTKYIISVKIIEFIKTPFKICILERTTLLVLFSLIKSLYNKLGDKNEKIII